MASIREVAQLSGVSVATVSRVLNGSAPVREETRQRVLERVRELDYVPNAAARTLVRRRSQVIGVVVNTGDAHPDLKHPFFGEVLVGLRQALGASHYDLLLFTGAKGFLRRAVHHQLDGLVLMGVDRRDPDLRGALERGLPAMNVDLDVSGRRAGYVMSDNVGGARIGDASPDRAGPRPHRDDHGPLEHEAGDRSVARISRRAPRPPPFVPNDVRARRRLLLRQRPRADASVARTAASADGDLRGKRRDGDRCSQRDPRGRPLGPRRRVVVGFDDIDSASLLRPPLTTIRQNKTALGRVAGDSLIRLIEDEHAKPPKIALPVELVERQSAGTAR